MCKIDLDKVITQSPVLELNSGHVAAERQEAGCVCVCLCVCVCVCVFIFD